MPTHLTEFDRERLVKALSALVGLPLTDMWRYGSQKFEFGDQVQHVNQKGEEFLASDWGLVAGDGWTVIGPNFELSHEAFKADKTRDDEHAFPFYTLVGEGRLSVEAVRVDTDGRSVITLTDGFSIEFFCLDPSDGSEILRLMGPEELFDHHVVLTCDRGELTVRF